MVSKIVAVSNESLIIDGVEKSAVNMEYNNAVLLAGASPLMIPVSNQKEYILKALSVCDGVIITGGCDVDPNLYHEDVTVNCGGIDKKRDEFELLLIECALELKLPILGICRGHQMLNVYFGGSLHQDINTLPNVIQHVQRGSRGQGSQYIKVIKDSFLYEAIGDLGYVNSYHHQSVKKIANHFKVTAKANDGIIEAIEHDTLPIYGVQFHPEVMAQNDEKMLNIFKKFIEKL